MTLLGLWGRNTQMYHHEENFWEPKKAVINEKLCTESQNFSSKKVHLKYHKIFLEKSVE